MGFAGFIALTVLGSYALYLLFLVAVGFFATEKENKGTRLVLVFLGLAPALIFWVDQEIGSYQYKKNQEQYNQKLASHKADLEIACQAESVLTVHKKIPRKSGIFYQPVSAPTEYLNKKEALRNKCREEIDKEWGYKYCQKKYNSKISIAGYDMFFYLTRYAQAINIEWKNKPSELTPWKAKFSGFQEKEKPTDKQIDATRWATKEWWSLSGQLATIQQSANAAAKKEYEKLAMHQFIDRTPVKHLGADFRFQIEDLSTQFYREKGLRKFRLSLTELKTNKLLSEYIGFDTINADTSSSSRHYFSIDNCVSLITSRIDKDDSHDNHTIINYFFSHAVDKKKTLPVPRLYHYP